MADRSLEELSGVNRSSLSRLLRGESWGTLPVIARLEQALGKTSGATSTGTPSKSPAPGTVATTSTAPRSSCGRPQAGDREAGVRRSSSVDPSDTIEAPINGL